MLKNIEQYLNYQGIYLSPVEPFSADDFILVVNDRVRKFYEDREKPELGYTFFIDYLVNAISRNNKGSVRGISARISKFLCTVLKFNRENPELVLLTKFLTPTYYGTTECIVMYLRLRKVIMDMFNFDLSPTNKLNGQDIDFLRAKTLCLAMKISFSATCKALRIESTNYNKAIPAANLISAMLEVNYINNKDSFELKRKKLQEEYDNKMNKNKALEPPEKWKKPGFMDQILTTNQDCDDTIKKALFRQLSDTAYTDRAIKVNENYEPEFLKYIENEIYYSLKMINPAITKYDNMLKTDIVAERDKIHQICKLLTKKLELLKSKIQTTVANGINNSNQNDYQRNCVTFYAHVFFKKRIVNIFPKLYPNSKLELGNFEKNEPIDVPTLSEIKRFTNRLKAWIEDPVRYDDICPRIRSKTTQMNDIKWGKDKKEKVTNSNQYLNNSNTNYLDTSGATSNQRDNKKKQGNNAHKNLNVELNNNMLGYSGVESSIESPDFVNNKNVLGSQGLNDSANIMKKKDKGGIEMSSKSPVKKSKHIMDSRRVGERGEKRGKFGGIVKPAIVYFSLQPLREYEYTTAVNLRCVRNLENTVIVGKGATAEALNGGFVSSKIYKEFEKLYKRNPQEFEKKYSSLLKDNERLSEELEKIKKQYYFLPLGVSKCKAIQEIEARYKKDQEKTLKISYNEISKTKKRLERELEKLKNESAEPAVKLCDKCKKIVEYKNMAKDDDDEFDLDDNYVNKKKKTLTGKQSRRRLQRGHTNVDEELKGFKADVEKMGINMEIESVSGKSNTKDNGVAESSQQIEIESPNLFKKKGNANTQDIENTQSIESQSVTNTVKDLAKNLFNISKENAKGDISTINLKPQTGKAPPPIHSISKKYLPLKEEGPSQLIKSELKDKVETAKKNQQTDTSKKEVGLSKVDVQGQSVSDLKEKVAEDARSNMTKSSQIVDSKELEQVKGNIKNVREENKTIEESMRESKTVRTEDLSKLAVKTKENRELMIKADEERQKLKLEQSKLDKAAIVDLNQEIEDDKAPTAVKSYKLKDFLKGIEQLDDNFFDQPNSVNKTSMDQRVNNLLGGDGVESFSDGKILLHMNDIDVSRDSAFGATGPPLAPFLLSPRSINQSTTSSSKGGPPQAPNLLGGPPKAPNLLRPPAPNLLGGPPQAPNLLGGPPQAPNLLGGPPQAPNLLGSSTKTGGPPTAPSLLGSPTKKAGSVLAPDQQSSPTKSYGGNVQSLFGGMKSDFMGSETSSMISGTSTPLAPSSLLNSQVCNSPLNPNLKSAIEFDYFPTTAKPAKLRSLFWEKIGNYEVNKSLWLAVHLNKNRINIKFEDLYTVFEDTKEIAQVMAKQAATSVFIEDPKRLSKIEFPLGKLLTLNKLTWPEITKGLNNYDYRKLGLETIYSLLPIIPTPEEIEKASHFTGDPEKLDTPSRWIYETSQIKNFGKRLKLFKFAMDFHEDAKKEMNSIKVIITVCKTIRNNPYFLEFLRQVLQCGNILTEGTRRSDAMGFRVIAWRCLLTCLGKDSKTTLLQYVMQKVYDSDQKFFDWLPALLKGIEAGSLIDIDALITSTSDLKEKFGDIMDELEDIEGSKKNDQSGFLRFFKPFYLNNVDIAIDLESRAKDIKEYFIDTALKFGEKPYVLKDQETDAIFAAWNKYFVELEKTLKLVVAYHKVNKCSGLSNLIRGITLDDGTKNGPETKFSGLFSNPPPKVTREYKAKKE